MRQELFEAVDRFGTLGGYSAILMARALPADGRLISLEAKPAPFDLVFIDADKVNTPNYFQWAVDRTRAGGLIVADNVVRDGSLGDPTDPDEATVAQRRLHEELRGDSRVSATTIQTVGVKGYDGFLIALVEGA